ncbi:hypothetical protein [Enterobacter hormaechei]|uniref:hypothetical protein n=1 Tax=Enterobacter hormaechei TaxID=158836 RepID=UPI00242CD4DA|nr:hypothetical protein [Enterobacter hormaechei]HEO8956317.1 hypothetical protein [Enterobacter hormaechei subsp. steigerwaltii]MEA5200620.1 hypothetical protein [Enterobacter hormaechei]WGA69585.1 hypothetical protein NFL05_16375 [Enterobacter hormaechei]WGA74071.1 hypothetical protein NFL06_16380 [Enterobacter hormaechei]HEO8959724.1 hypothetical protein [Enterobacter hormaechei subsp. steigerwaltii]
MKIIKWLRELFQKESNLSPSEKRLADALHSAWTEGRILISDDGVVSPNWDHPDVVANLHKQIESCRSKP